MPSEYFFKLTNQGQFVVLNEDGSKSPFALDSNLSPNQKFEMALDLNVETLCIIRTLCSKMTEVPVDNPDIVGSEFDGVISGAVTFKWGHTRGRQKVVDTDNWREFFSWVLARCLTLQQSILNGKTVPNAPAVSFIDEVTHIYNEEEIVRNKLDELLARYQKVVAELAPLREKYNKRGVQIHELQKQLKDKKQVTHKQTTPSKTTNKVFHPKLFNRVRTMETSSPPMKSGSDNTIGSLKEFLTILSDLGVLKAKKTLKKEE